MIFGRVTPQGKRLWILNRLLQPRIAALKVLVVDDDHYMRKVVRTMLMAIGVKAVYEAPDGAAGLDAIRQHNPDLVIVDWEMPMIDGAQFVRMVRAPGEFPVPDVPIIMLSGMAIAGAWSKPPASARINICSSLCPPSRRPHRRHHRSAAATVQLDGYYGPLPRRPVVMEDPKPADTGVTTSWL